MVDGIVSQPVYLTGRGIPEGRADAQIGVKYYDLDTGVEYIKLSGIPSSTTGWKSTLSNVGTSGAFNSIALVLALPSPSAVTVVAIANPVPGEPGFLWFDPSSNLASDPPNVYVPNDGGPGRWLLWRQ